MEDAAEKPTEAAPKAEAPLPAEGDRESAPEAAELTADPVKSEEPAVAASEKEEAEIEAKPVEEPAGEDKVEPEQKSAPPEETAPPETAAPETAPPETAPAAEEAPAELADEGNQAALDPATEAPQILPAAEEADIDALVGKGSGGAPSIPPPTGKPLTVRQYLDSTVVPVLRQGLRQLVKTRPEDPYEFLADFIKNNKP